jgi:2,3-bisphosphoglycerate-dependent phosphoglycerate mutase
MTNKLILMRHGRSAWNQKNLFTGWVDIPLDQGGIEESIQGGKEIRNVPIDLVFTSTLIRAQMTVALALLHHSSGKVPMFLHKNPWSKVHSDRAEVFPVHIAEELNERYYGDLQGLNKGETVQKYGDDQVQIWRRSYDVAPPGGESLEMTAKRTLPYFDRVIVPHLKEGKNVFIAAHGNSLRSIVMELDGLSPEEVVALEIPTGKPLIYTYDRGKWRKST